MKTDEQQFKLWLIIIVLLLFLGLGMIILIQTVQMKNKAELQMEERRQALVHSARKVSDTSEFSVIAQEENSITTSPGTPAEVVIQPLQISDTGFPFNSLSIPPVSYPFANERDRAVLLVVASGQSREEYSLSAGEIIEIPFLELGTYTVTIDGIEELTIIVE